jgi:hypothetical protein
MISDSGRRLRAARWNSRMIVSLVRGIRDELSIGCRGGRTELAVHLRPRRRLRDFLSHRSGRQFGDADITVSNVIEGNQVGIDFGAIEARVVATLEYAELLRNVGFVDREIHAVKGLGRCRVGSCAIVSERKAPTAPVSISQRFFV